MVSRARRYRQRGRSDVTQSWDHLACVGNNHVPMTDLKGRPVLHRNDFSIAELDNRRD
jgi:hypothetical protein